MFPKNAIATVTGIGGMAGGVSSMLMQACAGNLFVYADEVQLEFLGFVGKPAGYFIIGRILHHLLYLLSSLSGGLDHHEDVSTEI